jgi:hypothetical protein
MRSDREPQLILAATSMKDGIDMREFRFVRACRAIFVGGNIVTACLMSAGTAHAATTICDSVTNRFPNTQRMLRIQMLCSMATMSCGTLPDHDARITVTDTMPAWNAASAAH